MVFLFSSPEVLMSKLVFFDIDGTLIDVRYDIRKMTLESERTMDELKAKGHDVFLATGRCPCFIVDGVSYYDWSGLVTCNGAYCEYKGECVYKDVIPAEAVTATRTISEAHGWDFYLESRDIIYVRDKNDKRLQAFCSEWGMKPETLCDDFRDDDIETYLGMIVVYDEAEIAVMKDALSPYFDIQAHRNPLSFDLTLRTSSKATGIRKMVEALGREMKDTIAFGDGRNDCEMLAEAGEGVAMANAMPEALAVAQYTCPPTAEEGVSVYLMERGLIDRRAF